MEIEIKPAERPVLEEVMGMIGMFVPVGGAGLFGPSLRGPRRPSSNRPRPGTEEAARRLAAAEEKRARKAARRVGAEPRTCNAEETEVRHGS